MSSDIESLGLYLHLARASGQRRRPHIRTRLLLLAGVQAVELRLPRIAAACRQRVLQQNPHHLLRRWPDFETALADEEFRHFLRHLRRRYPRERAERLMEMLEIEVGRERETYYDDEEYAAALLGASLDELP